ncbi:hypothetical protein ISN76_19095 [Dyella halodurans]|uniref:Uncharacterized protein n=1 Tax=Dyella halodurans TaxID=1920171 RepID=A0ABV9C0P1_9GAMM|nr:hypothetical protein [Dyella halodurans]
MKRVLKALLGGFIFYAVVTTIAMVTVLVKCLVLGVHYSFLVALLASRVTLGSAAVIAIFTFITLGNTEGAKR